MNAEIVLSTSIYPRECLREAAAAYRGLCTVNVLRESADEYSIEITRPGDVADERQLVNEFLNYLLDLSLEKHLSAFQEGDGTDRVQTA